MLSKKGVIKKGLTHTSSSGKIALAIGNNAGVVQLVECLLAKEKVVGSNPIARSQKTLEKGSFLLFFILV